MHRARPRRHPEAAPPPGTVGAVVPRRTPPSGETPALSAAPGRSVGDPPPQRPEALRFGGSPSGRPEPGGRRGGRGGGTERRGAGGAAPDYKSQRAAGAAARCRAPPRRQVPGCGRRGRPPGRSALRRDCARGRRHRGTPGRRAGLGVRAARGGAAAGGRSSGPVPSRGAAESVRRPPGLARGSVCAGGSGARPRPCGLRVGRRRGRASRPPRQQERTPPGAAVPQRAAPSTASSSAAEIALPDVRACGSTLPQHKWSKHGVNVKPERGKRAALRLSLTVRWASLK